MSTSSRPRAGLRAGTSAFGAVLLIACACLCGGPAAAWAADTASSTPAPVDVLVSADGDTFTTHLAGGLFDSAGLLVPGGAVAATLWVRNPTNDDADLQISIRTLTLPPGSFADDVTMSVRGTGGGGLETSDLRALTPDAVVVPAQVIGPGVTVALTITWSLADVSGVVDQGDGAAMDLLVSMVETTGGLAPHRPAGGTIVAVTGGAGAQPSAYGGRMANSGVHGGDWLWPLSGVMLGLGAVLVGARRRRQQR